MRKRVALLLALVVAAGCGGSSGGGAGAPSASVVAPATSGTASPATPAPAGSASATPGALLGDPLAAPSARTGVLRDALGRQLLLRGANLSERSKRPPFGQWLTPAHVDAFVRLGFDHVRFLLTWEAIEPRDGHFDDAYLDGVRRELSWFEARGIQVVLDLHQDQFGRRFGGDGFPEWTFVPDQWWFLPDVIGPFPTNYANPKVLANFSAFYGDPSKRARMARAWAYAASKLKGSPAVIGYDLLNEPFPGLRVPWDFEAHELSTLEGELCQAIRAEDPDRILFFEPQLQAALFPATGLQRPADPNVCYAPHWYDPVVDVRAAQGLKPYDGDWTRTRNALANVQAHARGLQSPVWLGEYGIERRRGGAREYVLDHARLLDESLLSACYWEINPIDPDLFSLVDPSGQDDALAADVSRPHPRATAGTLRRVLYDPAARRLEVEWTEGQLGPGAPTLVELPVKHFPAGAPLDVSLASDPSGSWRFEREAATGRLAVWADPGTARHVLVVKPR